MSIRVKFFILQFFMFIALSLLSLQMISIIKSDAAHIRILTQDKLKNLLLSNTNKLLFSYYISRIEADLSANELEKIPEERVVTTAIVKNIDEILKEKISHDEKTLKKMSLDLGKFLEAVENFSNLTFKVSESDSTLANLAKTVSIEKKNIESNFEKYASSASDSFREDLTTYVTSFQHTTSKFLLVVGIVFLAVLFFLISFFFLLGVISRLRLLQDHLTGTNIDSISHFKGASHRDEIGSLVDAYNKMITNINESKEMLIESKKKVEEALQIKQVFLANISHELRTPMHGILSFSSFGKQKIGTVSNEKLKSYFEEIHSCALGLLSLLNDLLDLSKLEANKMKFEMTESDFIMTVDGVLHELKALYDSKGLQLRKIVNSETIEGVFDQHRIVQVVRNILSNAAKFSKEGSTVVIVIGQTQDRINCSVRNHGIGIPEEELERIFDKFTQSSRTKSNSGGTGLGLAICKEIIEHHGGKIWASNGSDNETQMNFEIPTCPPNSVG